VKSVFACTERIVRVMTRKDQHAYLACALARWENEGGSLASTGERSNSKEEREIWHKQYARRVRAIALSRPRRRRRSHIQLCRPGCSIVCLGSRRPDHHVPSTSNRASRASGRAHAVAHRRSQARPERHDRPGCPTQSATHVLSKLCEELILLERRARLLRDGIRSSLQ
jgi:hypothetical protein